MISSCMYVEKSAQKFRHEVKYTISQKDAFILSGRLKCLFSYDQHADSRGIYRVNSLYFDTPYDKALKEKSDGLCHREKFRLRYYGHSPEFVQLEKKIKANGLCGKRNAKLSLYQTRKLLNGYEEILLNAEEPLCLELYSKIKGQLLQPKAIVSYNREAFLYSPGNVRITIDRDLTTFTNPQNFLLLPDAGINMSEGLCVLEVKYDAFLPELVQLAIEGFTKNTTAFSKYAAVRRYE